MGGRGGDEPCPSRASASPKDVRDRLAARLNRSCDGASVAKWI